MNQPIPFQPRPLAVLAAIVLMLSASLAFAQTPLRSTTSPAPARSAGTGSGTGTSTTPRALPVAPGSGTAALPPGAPSPSGLASPSPFPAGIPSTIIAAPGTSAALTGPVTTIAPSAAGVSTATTVPSSVRGVVNPQGNATTATATTDPGAFSPSSSNATLLDPNGAASAGNGGFANTPAASFPGAATGVNGTTGINGTTGLQGGGGVSGGLSNGVPSVSPTVAQLRGPVTALQIVQMFSSADQDGDGLLTRAEALRLPIVTMSFDDMDTNRDGVVSRSEYGDSLR